MPEDDDLAKRVACRIGDGGLGPHVSVIRGLVKPEIMNKVLGAITRAQKKGDARLRMAKGGTLKQLREISGLSQIQISRLTGMSPAKLSLAENDLCSLTREEQRSIVKVIVDKTTERHTAVMRLARILGIK